MAAGGMMAGMMIGRNLDLLKTGIAAAADGWKPLVARGYALGSEEMTTPFTQASGNTRPVLTGTASGASFAVHIRSDAVYYARTEVTTTAPKPCDAIIGLHFNPGGIMGYLREWIGQDIQIGDELFDPAYLITGKPESAPVSFLVPSVRQTFLAIGEKLAGFSYTNGEVKVVLHGVETDAAVVGAAIEIAAAAATWSAGK